MLSHMCRQKKKLKGWIVKFEDNQPHPPSIQKVIYCYYYWAIMPSFFAEKQRWERERECVCVYGRVVN